MTPKEGTVSSDYAANVNDSDCNLTGTLKYPGLRDTEMNRSSQYYAFENWTGIDCAGFVQRMVTAAKVLSIPGVNCKINDLKDADTNPQNHLDDGGLHSQAFFTGTSRTASFDIPQGNKPSIISERNNLLRKLKKGDLIRYPLHISTVYSDRSTCSTSAEACNYEIVHAYGGNRYDFDGNGIEEKNEFSRKVVRTRQNISKPTGFGRIKLWD